MAGVKLIGRAIKEGRAEGEALVSHEPLGFFGGVDPETGVVIEPGHELEGHCIAGTILVFPRGKGSTVGSYTLYRLRKEGLAPAGIINARSEAVVAVGAIISEIPMVDSIDLSQIQTGDEVTINGDTVEVVRPAQRN
jgi:predicted aconitase with swiveling domain